MKSHFLKVFFASVLLFSAGAQAGWEPTFVDNFEGASLKESYWAYGRPNLSRRTQYYSSDAVQVKNGVLEIGAINQPEADRPYLSGAITTQGLFNQKHGYFEMRAKIPKGDGFWPAFWMMPTSGKWASEIDIAEFFGDKPGSVWYAFHHSSKLRNENSYLAPTFQDLSQSFNNYAVEWTPDRIDYLFNGAVMHSITDSVAVDKADSEMFMILNLALASQHTGFVTNINKDTDFSSRFVIDYVRVYKDNPSGRYATIPAASASVPNTLLSKIDNTAVSVKRIKGANERDIFRSPGRIKGTIELTSHAPSVQTNVVITLFKLENFIKHDGRYYNSAPLQSILKKKVTFSRVGEKQLINYEFGPEINTVGAYAVDVMIKDPVTQNKKMLDAHRIIQYVDSAIPESTMFFDGFVEAVDASYLNNTVSTTAQIQLQQALLVPYIDVKFTVIDNYTNAIVKTKTVRHAQNYVGRIAVDASIPTVLDIDGAYTVKIDVVDSSGVKTLKTFSQHITGTNGPVTPPVTEEPPRNWVPTFVDNFNGDSVKLENWGIGREVLSRRLQYYDKDAVAVKDGILNIKILNNKPESDRPYLTSALTTQGLFKQKEGYFEMRAKLPKGNGIWPAFWLLPESGKWESEIDISEFLGNKPDTIHYAYHYGNRLRNENSRQVSTLQRLTDAFNTYAVDWNSERIHYLFNGKIMHTVEGEDLVQHANAEMYLILNLALASQHTKFITNVDGETDLSSAYEIDYVRVFKEVPSGGFLGVPDSTVNVPDINGSAYDNTAISVDRIGGANADIMRTPGKIKGGIQLTSHSNSINSKVYITLFKLENINLHDGRYYPSAAIQTISNNVSFTRVGESLDINYEFDKQINVVGAYMVDVLIKDVVSGNKKILTGHRIIQYVDVSKPDTTIFFDGFVRKGSAGYVNGVISSSIDLQIQQALLTPYIDVRYSVIDDATGSVVKTEAKRIKHRYVGKMLIDQDISVNLNAQKSYSLRVEVLDASRKHRLESFTIPVSGANNTNPNPPPSSGVYALNGVSAKVSGGEINLSMDVVLPDGALFSSLKYIAKFYSLKNDSLIAKVIGEQSAGYNNGRQSISGVHAAPGGMANDQYRVVLIMFKNTWDESDKIIYETIRSTY